MNSEPGLSDNNYGGNHITTFSPEGYGRQLFADDDYVYFYFRARAGEILPVKDLASFTVFFYKGEPGAFLTLAGREERAVCGATIQSENTPLEIKVGGGAVGLLVAGVRNPLSDKAFLRVFAREDCKKVSKPWGHEIWINGDHSGYALKEICIKSGFRTSLQYHNFKRETNVLVEGNAVLHYKKHENIANDAVKDSDLAAAAIAAPAVINLAPKVLHRLESVGDILLYEVSTPHLDDVIRVSDDKNRSNGRIEEEHKNHG
ncbi:MAG: hypothetical protein WCW52_00950 [Elusimicrobiales bacterium]|jgi:hypothetical protein